MSKYEKLEAVATKVLGGKCTVLDRAQVEGALLKTPFAGVVHPSTDVFAVIQCERKDVHPISLHAILNQNGQQRLLMSSETVKAKFSLDGKVTEGGLRVGHIIALGTPSIMKGRSGGFFYRNNPIEVPEAPGIIISSAAATELRKAIEDTFDFLSKSIDAPASTDELQPEFESYSAAVAES